MRRSLATRRPICSVSTAILVVLVLAFMSGPSVLSLLRSMSAFGQQMNPGWLIGIDVAHDLNQAVERRHGVFRSVGPSCDKILRRDVLQVLKIQHLGLEVHDLVAVIDQPPKPLECFTVTRKVSPSRELGYNNPLADDPELVQVPCSEPLAT